jgi:hypothetical protein
MHTSGLVFTFSTDAVQAGAARDRIAAAGPFVLGECHGAGQTAVLETDAPESAHEWHDWAARLPGVEAVEVVFVHWDDASREVSS